VSETVDTAAESTEVTPSPAAAAPKKRAAKKSGAKKAAKKAPAKSPAKKAAKKEATDRAPRDHAYKLVKKSALPEKLSVQGAFIIEKLEAAGKDGLTKAKLAKMAENAPSKFPCTQPHDRAVGFYLSKFKSTGALDWVRE
jgi:polyphosphate kinase 2 (PPK2 family)